MANFDERLRKRDKTELEESSKRMIDATRLPASGERAMA